MNQVPLVFPEFGAVGVIKQVLSGALGQLVLGFTAKGVAQVKGTVGQLVSQGCRVVVVIEDKTVLSVERHKAFHGGIGHINKKEAQVAFIQFPKLPVLIQFLTNGIFLKTACIDYQKLKYGGLYFSLSKLPSVFLGFLPSFICLTSFKLSSISAIISGLVSITGFSPIFSASSIKSLMFDFEFERIINVSITLNF
jgi:hypothetical protein